MFLLPTSFPKYGSPEINSVIEKITKEPNNLKG